MKKIYLLVTIIVLSIFNIGCTSNGNVPIKEIIYIPVKDTINEQENIARIIRLEHDITLYQDSLKMIRDSLGEDLFIANYKLARIKYYTKIVDNKPAQIKFYKGWIKRTLNE